MQKKKSQEKLFHFVAHCSSEDHLFCCVLFMFIHNHAYSYTIVEKDDGIS